MRPIGSTSVRLPLDWKSYERKYQPPYPVVGADLQTYFMQFVDSIADELGTGFYRVHSDICAFKKLGNYLYGNVIIANLIIPKGALIYAHDIGWYDGSADRRKIRVSEAKVYSLIEKHTHAPQTRARSLYNPGFVYQVGDTVRPTYEFSLLPTVCTSGIHCYLNVYDAYNYMC